MKIKTTIIFYFILWTTICITTLSCQHQINDPIKTSRISDKVVIYEYMNVNVTAIKSKNGILIIDTHRSPATMNKIKKLIEKEFERKDFLYVINTHGDWDHCSGNQVFPDATIIGHENCTKAMQQLPTNSPELISHVKSQINGMLGRKEIKTEMEIWNQMLASIENEYKVTPPNKTFRDSLTLSLDDLTVRMFYCGNAHTDNDIFIYIPEEKLVITGDLFTSENSFGFAVNKMNDIPRVIEAMNRILRHPSGVEFVIPGHGGNLSGNDFVVLRDLLNEKFEKFQGIPSAVQLIESMIEKYGVAIAIQKYSKMESVKKKKYYYQEEEFNLLGSRYLRKGMIAEAIGVFRLSTDVFPNSALGYDYLGEAYLKNGKMDSSIANYKKSLQIFPNNRNAREILKEIDRAQ